MKLTRDLSGFVVRSKILSVTFIHLVLSISFIDIVIQRDILNKNYESSTRYVTSMSHYKRCLTLLENTINNSIIYLITKGGFINNVVSSVSF